MSVNQTINKISLFIPNLHGGGAERVFINLTRIFAKSGIEVELIVGNKEGILMNEVSDLNVYYLNKRSVSQCIWPLIKRLRSNPPSILLSAMPHANLAAIIAGRLANKEIKIVATVHENPMYAYQFFSLYEKLVLHTLKFVYPFAHALVTVSDGLLYAQRSFYGSRLPKVVTRIYNPIINDDLVIQHPSASLGKNQIKIISAGRLSFEKGFTTLITAFSQLDNTLPVTLTIYGEGPERDQLQKLVDELHLQQRVTLPGFTKDLSEKMREADIFVMSSKWEGFGNVLVEALACGCQIVSTNCQSGPSEILKDGLYGILVPVDDCHAMKTAVERILNGDTIQYNTSEAISPFTFKKIGEEYISLFKRINGHKK